MNSNNFFQLVADFEKNIDWLNQILKGGESDNVNIDGVVKPAISKDIAEKWAAISGMVQGRAAYTTKSDLPASPPPGVLLAEVWNDISVSNNGLYGWTGSIWEKSPYDTNPTSLVMPYSDTRSVSGNAVAHYINGMVDNHDQRADGGELTEGFIESSESNIPPLTPCDHALIRENYNVDYWLKINAGDLVTDGGTHNNLYVQYTPDYPLKKDDWVQVAFIVRVPEGSTSWPPGLGGPLYLWSPTKALSDVEVNYFDVADGVRIVWHTAQIKDETTSKQLLIGSKFGQYENDFYICGWGCRVLESKPSGLVVDMSKNQTGHKLRNVDQLYSDVYGYYIPTAFNSETILANYSEDDWVNPPPPEAIVVNTDHKIKENHGVERWVKFLADTGYTDGGQNNNVYMSHLLSSPSDLSDKWVTCVFIARKDKPSSKYPNFYKAFTWDPVRTYDIDFQTIGIDDVTAIFWGKFKADSTNYSNKVLIGSNFGVLPNDFYIGGWRMYITDDELMTPPGYKETITGRLDIHEVEIEKLKSRETDDFKDFDYYALGDSITKGAGSSGGSTSWADHLHATLRFKSFTKKAVNGSTAMPTAGRSKLKDQVTSVGSDADFITVLIGVNDYNLNNPLGDVDATLGLDFSNLDDTADFCQAYRWCMETLKRNHNKARIYALIPLQTTWGGDTDLQLYRDAIKKIAGYLSIPVIDSDIESGLWGPDKELLPDGIHPGDTGYQIMANYVARKVQSL